MFADSSRMDTLPSELMTYIIQYLVYTPPGQASHKLAPYASISQSWRHIVEQFTFSSIAICNTEYDQFLRIFSESPERPPRKHFLRRLILRIRRPDDRVKSPWRNCCTAQREEEINYNNALYTSGITSLYNTLKSWDLRSPIDLEIGIWTTENVFQSREVIRTRPRFIPGKELARLECVKKLTLFSDIESDTFFFIVKGLPGLRKLVWKTQEWDNNLNSLVRMKGRYDAAKSLRLLPSLCPMLEKLELHCGSNIEVDDKIVVPSVLPPNSPDKLSESFILISHSLKKVTLTDAVVTSQLFSSHNGTETSWPNLTHFQLTFSKMAADGGWLFDRDPNYPPDQDPQDNLDRLADLDRPVNQFNANKLRVHAEQKAKARTTNFDEPLLDGPVDSETEELFYGHQYFDNLAEVGFRVWPSQKLELLLLNMARAVQRMPALRAFVAEAKMPDRPVEQKFGCHYYSPGEVSEDIITYFENDGVNRDKKRLYWWVPYQWRMSSEMERCWREIICDGENGEGGVIDYYEYNEEYF